MRKPITILVSILVLCFAAAYSATTAVPQKQPAHKTFVGTVESVTVGDAAKGTKSELAVTNEAKQKMTFVILATTVLHDAQGKPITLDKFKAGNKVTVSYETTAAGVNEAISIKMMK